MLKLPYFTVLCGAIGLALSALANCAETGYAERELDIRAAPRADAASLGKIPKGGQFELLKKQMSWAQISTAGLQGWVPFYFLVSGTPSNELPPARAMAEALGLASSRQNSGSIVASVGIRGLNEEQLKSAQFNEPELRKLESLIVQPQTAAAFAGEAALAARKVEYMAAPVPASNNGGNNNFTRPE